MRRVAYGNVQLIRSHHLQRRISILPPELMPNDGDLDGVARTDRVLDTGNYARSRQKQDHHNENRNDRPRQFQLSAAINLRGFASIGRLALSESHNRVDKQTENNHEYRCRHLQHKKRKIKYRLRRRRHRSESICWTQKGARWIGERDDCRAGEGDDGFNGRKAHKMSLPWSSPDRL